MNIVGLQKLTTLDFPGVLSCIIFTQGCNFKCPYCHNSMLVPTYNSSTHKKIEEAEIINFLEKRKNVLDGIVITGGEPLLQKDIEEFIKKIKEIGYKVKLDTNGSNHELLKKLIQSNLVDYVAMDIKNDFENYSTTINTHNINLENIKKSIELLKSSTINFEFRTTIVKEFHSLQNIQNIIKIIGNDAKLFLQNYEESENVFDHTLHSFSQNELLELKEQLKPHTNVQIRGI